MLSLPTLPSVQYKRASVGRYLVFSLVFFPSLASFISVYLHMYVRLPRLGAYRVLSGTPTV